MESPKKVNLVVVKYDKTNDTYELMTIQDFCKSKPFGKNVTIALLREMIGGAWYQNLTTGYYLTNK